MATRQPTRPNVVVVLLDDMGFADPSCFGSDLDTPTFDELAAGGLRYTSFHTTPLCSPTRACVLTGRNHHAVGIGSVVDTAGGEGGYSGHIPRSAAMVSRHLRDGGYATFAIGKWHLAPTASWGPAGPYDRWPLGQGFDRYYGFVSGHTDQWFPHLVSGNEFVELPARPEDGYHLTEDLVDHAITMIDEQAHTDPEKPFFMYVAPGAVHSPHQAPREWIEHYRGRFDHGWDVERERRFRRQLELGVIPPGTSDDWRPPELPSWVDLTDDARAVYARQMEVYAAFVSHTDAQIGRLVAHLKDTGAWENTLFLVTSDNGPDPSMNVDGLLDQFEMEVPQMRELLDEFGGWDSYGGYSSGWAWTGATPFRYWKGVTWLGGVRMPLIAHWPAAIPEGDGGSFRRQFLHAIDLAPTILDAAGIVPAEVVDGVPQQRIDGSSALRTIVDPAAPDPRDTQYFEMGGSRAIYHDGWKATADRPPAGNPLDNSPEDWALYHLRADASEAHDLSASEPERLTRMIALWDEEAERNQVYPAYDPGEDAYSPRLTHVPRQRYEFTGSTRQAEVPFLGSATFRLGVDITVAPRHVPEGVLWAYHPSAGGVRSYTMPRPSLECHVVDGKPVVTVGHRRRARAEFTSRLPDGPSRITLVARESGVGVVTLEASGTTLESVALDLEAIRGWGEIGLFAWVMTIYPGLLTIGRGRGLRWDDYDPDGHFDATIDRVLLEFDDSSEGRM